MTMDTVSWDLLSPDALDANNVFSVDNIQIYANWCIFLVDMVGVVTTERIWTANKERQLFLHEVHFTWSCKLDPTKINGFYRTGPSFICDANLLWESILSNFGRFTCLRKLSLQKICYCFIHYEYDIYRSWWTTMLMLWW